MSWLGIDLGTQSAKAVIAGDSGEIWATASVPLSSVRDGVRHEQDPEAWLTAAAQVTRQALEVLPAEALPIRGIAICGTSGTLATVTSSGAPVGPGIMYDDGRGAASLPRVLAADPDFWAAEGMPPQASWAIAKIAHLAEIGLPTGAHHFAHQVDVVGAQIVGHRVATDWSNALKSAVDLTQASWPERLFRGIGVSPAALPEVVAPGTLLGVSSPAWAALTGLPAGTPLYAGATDGCAAQFGAGALAEGDWHSVVGTTLVIKGVTPDRRTDAGAGIYSHRSPEGTSWLPGGASSAGAGALTQFLPAGAAPARISAQAASRWAEPGAELPVSYPLVGQGERFPVSAPTLQGFLNIPGQQISPLADLEPLAERDPETALTAIFVGLAAVERLCYERLGVLGTGAPFALTTSGGGSNNEDWVRLRASMLGVPITRLDRADGALGMAMLAAWAASEAEAPRPTLAQVASRMRSVLDVIPPDPALTQTLNAAYARFTESLKEATQA